MSKHTPGPWSIPHFARSNAKCKCHYVFSDSQSGFGSVASIPFGNEDEGHVQSKANANLIASAPDLLEALENLVNLDQRCGWHSKQQDAAIIAIARAKGESQ